jgi:hypothetical protein
LWWIGVHEADRIVPKRGLQALKDREVALDRRQVSGRNQAVHHGAHFAPRAASRSP